MNLSRPKPDKYYWEYSIVKWDETGNILLEKHLMVVQRQQPSTALDVVYRKYPRKDGYSAELNDKWLNHADGTTKIGRYLEDPRSINLPR